MSEVDEPRPALPPALFWRILVAGNLTSLAVLLFVFHRMARGAYFPDYGPWLLGFGLLLALPAFLYRKRAQLQLQRADAEGKGDNARRLIQLSQVVYSCALAELPGLLGTIYYIATLDWGGTVLLLAVTGILLWQAKPQG